MSKLDEAMFGEKSNASPETLAAIRNKNHRITESPSRGQMGKDLFLRSLWPAEDHKPGWLNQTKPELLELRSVVDEEQVALVKWFAEANFVLQKNDQSRVHRLKSSMRTEMIFEDDEDRVKLSRRTDAGRALQSHVFVVKHNWASVISPEIPLAINEIRLPYDYCTFEFRISGRTVIIPIWHTDSDTYPILYTMFIDCGRTWYVSPSSFESEKHRLLGKLLCDQIAAIAVALESEIATHSVTRAPLKLNEKRIRQGKTLLSDFHIVDLSKRKRSANSSTNHSGRRVRLHFRRGHWRHYEEQKTWIKWMLVGDPDLGFIFVMINLAAFALTAIKKGTVKVFDNTGNVWHLINLSSATPLCWVALWKSGVGGDNIVIHYYSDVAAYITIESKSVYLKRRGHILDLEAYIKVKLNIKSLAKSQLIPALLHEYRNYITSVADSRHQILKFIKMARDLNLNYPELTIIEKSIIAGVAPRVKQEKIEEDEEDE